MLDMLRSPAVTRRHATDISRMISVIGYPDARRAHWHGQVTGIIALTFTA
jgi:hypothetical protein